MKDSKRPDPDNQSTFYIAKPGYYFIIAGIVATAFFALTGAAYLAIVGLVVTVFLCYFFRDPDRVVPMEEGSVVSPADGRVIIAEPVDESPFFKGMSIKISIFMSVFNVHVNRIPYEGRVSKISYFPGKFFSANLDKASKENEHNAVLIETETGKKICMVQIAGLIARRIICRLKETKCIDIFENIIINNVGTPINKNYDDKKIILINDPASNNLFEMTTLNKLRDFSTNNPDMRVLYLHTKGVSHSKNYKAVNDWIDQMLYFLIEKHPICTEVLSRGFDTVGCNYLRDYRRSIPVHYSGNFWWASSKYLATLPKMHESTTNKTDTEFWLCKNNPIMYVMDTSNVDQYLCEYPREKYADKK